MHACVCVCVCVHVHEYACACVWERERQKEREFCPLSGFWYTGTLSPVPVYRTEATRIGALGITDAYRQPYDTLMCSVCMHADSSMLNLLETVSAVKAKEEAAWDS